MSEIVAPEKRGSRYEFVFQIDAFRYVAPKDAVRKTMNGGGSVIPVAYAPKQRKKGRAGVLFKKDDSLVYISFNKKLRASIPIENIFWMDHPDSKKVIASQEKERTADQPQNLISEKSEPFKEKPTSGKDISKNQIIDRDDAQKNRDNQKSHREKLIQEREAAKLVDPTYKSAYVRQQIRNRKEFVHDVWKGQQANPSRMIRNMDFINRIQSKRNAYFCYQFNNLYLISTELKEITRMNVVTRKEVNEIYDFFVDSFSFGRHNVEELIGKAPSYLWECARPAHYSLYCQASEEFHQDLYWVLLHGCYALTACGKLELEKDGGSVYFRRVKRQKEPVPKGCDDIYKNFSYVGTINANTGLFTNKKLYFTLRLNNFRGSMVPYLKEEIEFLQSTVKGLPSGYRIDPKEFVDHIDYGNRYHIIYNKIENRNIRNDRPDKDFFESRLRNSFDVIEFLTRDIKSTKEGRKKIFIKK